MLGPVKGLRRLGLMGELTDVASAKRAVRGVWMDSLEEPLLSRGGRVSISSTRTCGVLLFFSSAAADAALLSGLDMLAVVVRFLIEGAPLAGG